tara:strand:- start:15 stop:347 length:333 start_codon:yes stop_codon:yes gene_type:complete
MTDVTNVGSRVQVANGTALKTAGGLKKRDLKKNSSGRWVSKKMSAKAKKKNTLGKLGFVPEKGGKFKRMPKKGTEAYKEIMEGTSRGAKKGTRKGKGKSKKTSKGKRAKK